MFLLNPETQGCVSGLDFCLKTLNMLTLGLFKYTTYETKSTTVLEEI